MKSQLDNMSPNQWIIQVLNKNDKPISWLAEKISMPVSTLRNKLQNSNDLYVSEYEEIKRVFTICDMHAFTHKYVESLEVSVLNLNTYIAKQIGNINNTFAYLLEDGIVCENDKKELLEIAEISRTEINNHFNKFIERIEK